MLTFKVHSNSSGEIYTLIAHVAAQPAVFTCTCQAGANGTACKHRLSLLIGDVSDLASENHDDVAQLRELFSFSGIYDEMARIDELEAQAAGIKRQITSRKKRVSAILLGHGLRLPDA